MTSEDIAAASGLLKDFSYHCRSLVFLTGKLKEIQNEIDTFGMRSESIVKQKTDRSATYHEDKDGHFLAILEEKDRIEAQYIRHQRKAKETALILQSLDLSNEDINLLILQYERNYSYEQLSKVYRCSVVKLYQWSHEILEDFTREYIRRGYTY